MTLNSSDWTTETKKVSVTHSQKNTQMLPLRDALTEIASELGDPTIEEVDIAIAWDQLNGGTISITIGR